MRWAHTVLRAAINVPLENYVIFFSTKLENSNDKINVARCLCLICPHHALTHSYVCWLIVNRTIYRTMIARHTRWWTFNIYDCLKYTGEENQLADEQREHTQYTRKITTLTKNSNDFVVCVLFNFSVEIGNGCIFAR